MIRLLIAAAAAAGTLYVAFRCWEELAVKAAARPDELWISMPTARERQIARNGRWGTCAACPRTSAGEVYPEFCTYSDRYDHQLGANQ